MGSLISDEHMIDELMHILGELINTNSDPINKGLIKIFNTNIISYKLVSNESYIAFFFGESSKLVLHEQAKKNLMGLILQPTLLGYALNSVGKKKILLLKPLCPPHLLALLQGLIDRFENSTYLLGDA
jgi:hypothetical protein